MLEINGHRSNAETIEDYLSREEDLAEDDFDGEQKARIVASGTLIRLQFYPDNPVGFYVVFDCSVESALRKAGEILERESVRSAGASDCNGESKMIPVRHDDACRCDDCNYLRDTGLEREFEVVSAANRVWIESAVASDGTCLNAWAEILGNIRHLQGEHHKQRERITELLDVRIASNNSWNAEVEELKRRVADLVNIARTFQMKVAPMPLSEDSYSEYVIAKDALAAIEKASK